MRFRTWSTVEVQTRDTRKTRAQVPAPQNVAEEPAGCPGLVLQLSLDGPFSLLRCASTEFSYLGADCSAPIKLLPAQSMGIDILFEKPPLPHRIGDEPLPLEHLYRGDLNITFSTGQLQTIALKATVLSPTLVVQPAAHAFGVVRADKIGTARLLVEPDGGRGGLVFEARAARFIGRMMELTATTRGPIRWTTRPCSRSSTCPASWRARRCP